MKCVGREGLFVGVKLRSDDDVLIVGTSIAIYSLCNSNPIANVIVWVSRVSASTVDRDDGRSRAVVCYTDCIVALIAQLQRLSSKAESDVAIAS